MARTPRTKAQTAAEASRVRSQQAGKEELPAHEADAAAKKAASVSQAVGQITAESALKNLTDARLKLGKVFDGIGNDVLEQTTLLANLKEQNKTLQAEIEELHGKEVIASSLKDAIAEHDSKVAELEDAFAARKAELETQQASINDANTRKNAEAEAARRKEVAEYQYNTQQTRKVTEEQYNFERSKVVRDNQEKDAVLSKGWNDRELALKNRETEIKSLEAQVAGIPALVKKEVDTEVAKATSAQKSIYGHEKALAEANAASERKISAIEIGGLKETIAKQATQLEKLAAELTEARKENNALATEALKASSGQQTLAAMKEYQAGQNQNKPNGAKS